MFIDYYKNRGYKTVAPSHQSFLQTLDGVLPGITQHRLGHGGKTGNGRDIPAFCYALEQFRKSQGMSSFMSDEEKHTDGPAHCQETYSALNAHVESCLAEQDVRSILMRDSEGNAANAAAEKQEGPNPELSTSEIDQDDAEIIDPDDAEIIELATSEIDPDEAEALRDPTDYYLDNIYCAQNWKEALDECLASIKSPSLRKAIEHLSVTIGAQRAEPADAVVKPKFIPTKSSLQGQVIGPPENPETMEINWDEE